MASMMNKFGMINSCEIILKNKNKFFAKNYFRCALYLYAHYTQ